MTGLTLGGAGGTAYGATDAVYGQTTPALTPDTTLLVGRSRADGLQPPTPDITIGDTTTFDLVFETGRHMPNAEDRYLQVRDRLHYANDDAITTDTMYDGTPWFTENHNRETLLVKVDPGRDIHDITPVWGVIAGGSDSTERAHRDGVAAQVAVDVFVLASAEDYDTRAEIRADFER